MSRAATGWIGLHPHRLRNRGSAIQSTLMAYPQHRICSALGCSATVTALPQACTSTTFTGCRRCLAAFVNGLREGAEDSRFCNISRSSSNRECLTGSPCPIPCPPRSKRDSAERARAGWRPDAAGRHLSGRRLRPRGCWLRICPAGAGVPVLSHMGVGLGVLSPSLREPALCSDRITGQRVRAGSPGNAEPTQVCLLFRECTTVGASVAWQARVAESLMRESLHKLHELY